MLLAQLDLDAIQADSELNTHLKTFLSYASYKICDQALPDFFDGLLPAQRKLLLSMQDLGALPGKKLQKSSRITAQSAATYHPVGNTYDVLVNMSQKWRVPVLLTDPEGNWGEPESGIAAAERYTEIRYSKFGEEVLLRDLPGQRLRSDQTPHGVVPVALTYTDLHLEEVYLPVRLPLLLLNGSNGIAVGLAQTFQPLAFNSLMGELQRFVATGEIKYENLRPGYVTRPLIATSQEDFINALRTGRGSIRTVAKIEYNRARNGHVDKFIVTNPPPGVVLNDIGNTFNAWRLEDSNCPFSHYDNESSLSETRLVFKLRTPTSDHNLLDSYKQLLYRKTPLSQSQTVNMTALKDRFPIQYNLETLLTDWIEERLNIIQRLAQRRVKELEATRHRLDLMVWARLNLDEIIPIIRNSKYEEVILACFKDLPQGDELTAEDVAVILGFNLRSLSSLSSDELEQRIAKNATELAHHTALVNDPAVRRAALSTDLAEIAEKAPSWGVVSHDCQFDTASVELLSRKPPTTKKLTVVAGPWHATLQHKGDLDILVQTQKGAIMRISNKSVRSTPYLPDLIDAEDRIIAATFSNAKELFFLTDQGKMLSLPQEDLPMGQPLYPARIVQLARYKGSEIKTLIPIFQTHDKPDHLLVTGVKGSAKRVPLKQIGTTRQSILLDEPIKCAAFVRGNMTFDDGHATAEPAVLWETTIAAGSPTRVGRLSRLPDSTLTPTRVENNMHVGVSEDKLAIFKKTPSNS